MKSPKRPRKRSIFARRRYWYHISTTLKRKTEHLTPWDNSKGFNRTNSEPDVPRICVAPSVAHCLAAVPYYAAEKYNVYRTKERVIATHVKVADVFDANVTQEGWIQTPTTFVKLGKISLEQVEKRSRVKDIIHEAASSSDPRLSGKVLRWWQRRHLTRFLKRA